MPNVYQINVRMTIQLLISLFKICGWSHGQNDYQKAKVPQLHLSLDKEKLFTQEYNIWTLGHYRHPSFLINICEGKGKCTGAV